jgi:septal ring factor EnvC (AmiA/AmiB activator)
MWRWAVMDLSDPKTWTDGFWLVVSAPHIAGPLVAAVGTAVWWFRGTLERSKRDGLQKDIKGRDEIINGRDVQIAGLNVQITDLNIKRSILQDRLDAAKEQQSYLTKKLEDAQAEIAKLKQQIEDKAAPEVLRNITVSALKYMDQAALANTDLGNTIKADPGKIFWRKPAS